MRTTEPFSISGAAVCFVPFMNHKDWLKVKPCQKGKKAAFVSAFMQLLPENTSHVRLALLWAHPIHP